MKVINLRKIIIKTVGIAMVLTLFTRCLTPVYTTGTTSAVNYTQPQAFPPSVSISYPATNFTSVGNYLTVQGNIQNIQSANQISLSQNGYPVRYFTYDPYSGNFHFQTFLQQGTNNIIVTANNPYGTGSQGVTVFFNPVNTINYNNTVYPNNTTNNTVYPNNTTNNTVYPNNTTNNTVYPNNTTNNTVYPNNTTNNTVYPNNTNNNTVNPNNNVNPNNTINPNTIHSNNNAGAPPMVQYTSPYTSPEDVTTPSMNISAMVQNVSSSSEIIVSVNGTNLSSFNFNPTAHTLTFTANLLTGFNSVHISATNAFGTDSKSTVIDYKPTGSPPRIAVFNPATSPFASISPNVTISGYVYNVTSSSEITVKDNGNMISFSYNSNTQEIDIPVNLATGSNQVIISASNPSGNDTKQVSLLLVNKNCGPNNNPNLQTGGVTYIDQNNANNNPHTNHNPNIQTGGVIQPNGNNNNNPNLQTGGVTYIDQNNANNNPHTNHNPNLQTGGVIQPNGNNNPNLQTGGVTYIDQNNANNNPHTNHNPNLQTGGVIQPNGNTNNNPNLQTGGVTYIDQHNGSTSNINNVHNKPEITRTSPGSNPYTTMSGVISISANVSFVTDASAVSVTYDGSPVSFSYNPHSSEALNFTSPLRPGMNTFVIKANNSLGNAMQNIDINYVPTNTNGNVNGNPNLHFQGGTNIASNNPRGFAPQNNQPNYNNQIQPRQEQNKPFTNPTNSTPKQEPINSSARPGGRPR
ncbi:MAG: hypothetical protein ACYDCN_01300 [Bacteroidia bacterium]